MEETKDDETETIILDYDFLNLKKNHSQLPQDLSGQTIKAPTKDFAMDPNYKIDISDDEEKP